MKRLIALTFVLLFQWSITSPYIGYYFAIVLVKTKQRLIYRNNRMKSYLLLPLLAFLLLSSWNTHKTVAAADEQQISSEGNQILSSPQDVNERYIVLIIGRLGLANRLRSIADWHQVAALTDRTLLVGWLATSDCNALFTDLFESVPNRVKILPFQLPLNVEEATQFLERTAVSENVTYTTLKLDDMWAGGRQSFVLDKTALFSDTKAIITSYDGVLALDGVKCQQYFYGRSRFYQSLVPVKYVRDAISEIRDTYFYNRIMIGVHYRAHDPETDWGKFHFHYRVHFLLEFVP